MRHLAQLGLLFGFFVAGIFAQAITFQYFYDDRNQLAKVVDSTGIVLDYTYDPAGNIINVQRSAVPVVPGSLSIFNFNPSRGGGGTQVVIQGQGFSLTAAQNTVRFSGVQSNVIAANTSSLTVTCTRGCRERSDHGHGRRKYGDYSRRLHRHSQPNDPFHQPQVHRAWS